MLAGLIAGSAAAQPEAATREGQVEVESGVRIHFVEAGDRAAKATLLFVPGWSMSSAVWRDQIARFAPLARVMSSGSRCIPATSPSTCGG